MSESDKLVADILETFENPSRWPMDHEARAECIRKWYAWAKEIREHKPLKPASATPQQP